MVRKFKQGNMYSCLLVLCGVVFFLEEYIRFARCRTYEHKKCLVQTHILSLTMSVGNTFQAEAGVLV